MTPRSDASRPCRGQALQNRFAGSHHVKIQGGVHPLQHPDGAGGHLQLLTPRGTAQQHRRVSPRPVKFPGRPLPFRETATLQFNDQLARRTGRRQNRPGQRRRWRGSDALAGTGQQDRRQQPARLDRPLGRLHVALVRRRDARAVGLGVGEGERIATIAWNGYRHFELYFGVSGMGAVCHTINPRLFHEQIVYVINHAEDKYVFMDLTFVPLLEALAVHLPKVAGLSLIHI